MEKNLIRRAEPASMHSAALLAAELWPGHTAEELQKELEGLSPLEGAVFLAEEDGVPAGFAQCALRRDYVEGTHSSPVGYLEGVYVRPACRRRGLAKRLAEACEGWAKERGCAEFASDCGLDNTGSIAFHLGAGFEEANRIVCFTKRLGEEA